MNRQLNEECSNCGRPDAGHIAMYCSDMPQKFIRCADEKCWSTGRFPDVHTHLCTGREPCLELNDNDPEHKPTLRLAVLTERGAIKRFVAGSPEPVVGFSGIRTRSIIAQSIEFEWKDDKRFEIYAPETMNFRLLIAIQQSIVARVDVGYRKTDILSFDHQLSIDKAHEAAELNQTVAILSLEEDEKIDFETVDHVYHLQFKKHGVVRVLAQFDKIPKND